MSELSLEEQNKYIEELVQWQKNTNKGWDYIESHLYFIDLFNDLRDQDEEAFFYYKPIFIEQAKLRIQKQSTRKGVSTKKRKLVLD